MPERAALYDRHEGNVLTGLFDLLFRQLKFFDGRIALAPVFGGEPKKITPASID
jgi:hypothetical protein